MLDLEGKKISDWDKNYVSELSKMSPFIYKKLADHDRIPSSRIDINFTACNDHFVIL